MGEAGSEPGPAPGGADLRRQVAEALRQVLRAGATTGTRARATVGLGLSDLAALQVLDALAGEPQPVGRLSTALGLSSAAVTELVDRLERGGWVRRERDTRDRRRVLLSLQPKARTLGEDLLGPWAARIGSAVAGLSDDEARVVASFLAEVLGDVPAGTSRALSG